jgi:hypothetical protein
MFKSTVFGQPSKCPNRNCRTVFYSDSHLGWLPKSELEIYAVMRCTGCRDTFLVAQMLHQVHEYKELLPKRKRVPNKITIFSEEDKETFRKELYSSENPLWILYDGQYPGAFDTTSNEDV